MSENKKMENEEIKQGLEAFIDHELGFDDDIRAGMSSQRVNDQPVKADIDVPVMPVKKVSEPQIAVPQYVEAPTKQEKRRVEEQPRRKQLDSYEEEETVSKNTGNKKQVKKKNPNYLFYDDAFDDYEDDYEDEDEYDDYDENDEDDYPRRRQKPSKNKKSKKGKSKKVSHKKPSKKSSKKKGRKSKKQEEKKSHGFRNFLIFIVILLLLMMGAIYMFVGSVYNKMNYERPEEISFTPVKESGVINVLLIGNDSRLGADDGRSDAMILVSISDKTKTVTMTSFLRDMYVEIPGHDGNRLNAAYAYGGPELLMETIEQNFGVKIHHYALVNFEAFANLVDAVGGIELDVTNDEVQLINGYLMEYNQLLGRDLTYDWLDASLSGVIHLNGPQALAYTRNRYIGTDFGRTERQRKVLAEVFKKLPTAMAKNGNAVIDGLFPNLTTNLSKTECYQISLNGWKLLTYEMVQQAVPVEGTYKNSNIRGMAVLEVDFEANKQFLKETIYGK